jgi:hypothetical protein
MAMGRLGFFILVIFLAIKVPAMSAETTTSTSSAAVTPMTQENWLPPKCPWTTSRTVMNRFDLAIAYGEDGAVKCVSSRGIQTVLSPTSLNIDVAYQVAILRAKLALLTLLESGYSSSAARDSVGLEVLTRGNSSVLRNVIESNREYDAITQMVSVVLTIIVPLPVQAKPLEVRPLPIRWLKCSDRYVAVDLENGTFERFDQQGRRISDSRGFVMQHSTHYLFGVKELVDPISNIKKTEIHEFDMGKGAGRQDMGSSPVSYIELLASEPTQRSGNTPTNIQETMRSCVTFEGLSKSD